MGHAALNPARALADATRLLFKNPTNPLAYTAYGKSVAAAAELFERSTRRYGKPEWRIDSTTGRRRARAGAHRDGVGAAVLPPAAFRARLQPCAAPAAAEAADRRADVRPLRDAAARHGRGLPARSRRLHHRLARRAHGAGVAKAVSISTITSTTSSPCCTSSAATCHVIAVCQPAVPVLAAVALMEADDDPYVPHSMTLMGGPIDTRVNPDRGQQARRRARHRLVPPQRHHQGAVSASGLHARRLSGLPAAVRLHHHEPRPPHRRASRPVHAIW